MNVFFTLEYEKLSKYKYCMEIFYLFSLVSGLFFLNTDNLSVTTGKLMSTFV